jgi:hypothetical protein
LRRGSVEDTNSYLKLTLKTSDLELGKIGFAHLNNIKRGGQ